MFFSQLKRTWYKKGELNLRYQYRFYEENFLADLKIVDRLAEVRKDQARVSFRYQLSNSWEIGNRVEFVQFLKSGEPPQYGILAYQDLQWTGMSHRWKASGRLIYFNIDSYNARIYSFERDMLYSFSFPFFFHHGCRFYFNQRWNLNSRWTVWTKYGISKYFDIDHLGSGLDRIEQDYRSEIRLQVRFRW
ncbi:hypothetical protein [Sphingobacterium hotanense]|uniref:hypothetical protein n=1 Tax=Sphingobacterium hotanense TaxID=649196 RepID=UPI0011F3F3F3|nr:hypothetical protein [Sphingobacterium hotanense]